jgi:hypothetical protein
MLYIFIGNPREGKTISMTMTAKDFYDAGYTIYSNTWFSFPFTPLTRKMLLDWEKQDLNLPAKSVMCIDELGAWFDSRNSQNSNNKIMSYFISQLGKFTSNKSKGLTVLGTTQYFSNIDIRGRRICSEIIECKKLEELENEWVKVFRVWKKNDNLVLKTFKRELVLFDKKDFDLYDTQKRITSEIN